MRIVLMGMPGVGKGTQAVRLKEVLGILHVSTGDILREAVNSGSALGKRVKEHLEQGTLVPDELMADLIVERLGRRDAAKGFVLDGFPRTVEQVAILDRVLRTLGTELDGVFLLRAPEEEVVRRISGRRTCPGCGEVFHVNHRPPRSPGVCDRCGSALAQRSDDTEKVIRERLEVFKNQTLPAVEIYRERDLLREVEATGDPEVVFRRLRAAVERQ